MAALPPALRSLTQPNLGPMASGASPRTSVGSALAHVLVGALP